MPPWLLIILWLAFLGYLSFKVSRLIKQRRYGFAMAVMFLCVVIAYQIVGTWNRMSSTDGTETPSQTTPATQPASLEAIE